MSISKAKIRPKTKHEYMKSFAKKLGNQDLQVFTNPHPINSPDNVLNKPVKEQPTKEPEKVVKVEEENKVTIGMRIG